MTVGREKRRGRSSTSTISASDATSERQDALKRLVPRLDRAGGQERLQPGQERLHPGPRLARHPGPQPPVSADRLELRPDLDEADGHDRQHDRGAEPAPVGSATEQPRYQASSGSPTKKRRDGRDAQECAEGQRGDDMSRPRKTIDAVRRRRPRRLARKTTSNSFCQPRNAPIMAAIFQSPCPSASSPYHHFPSAGHRQQTPRSPGRGEGGLRGASTGPARTGSWPGVRRRSRAG